MSPLDWWKKLPENIGLGKDTYRDCLIEQVTLQNPLLGSLIPSEGIPQPREVPGVPNKPLKDLL